MYWRGKDFLQNCLGVVSLTYFKLLCLWHSIISVLQKFWPGNRSATPHTELVSGQKNIISEGVEDRISALPDSLLEYILSLLSMEGGTKEVVKTGILSQRWRRLWTRVRRLDYLGPFYLKQPVSSIQDLEKFIQFVDNTLFLDESNTIEEFSLSCFLSEDFIEFDFGDDLGGSDDDPNARRLVIKKFINHVDDWIIFALRKKVRTLILDFSRCHYFDISKGSGPCYKLPSLGLSHDFVSSTQTNILSYDFVNLGLSYCSFSPMGPIRWNSLKSLMLRLMELNDQVLENILSGTPLLEDFCLEGCTGITHLNVSPPLLQHLTVLDTPLNASLTLSVPCVKKLTLGGKMENFHLKDTSSLGAIELRVRDVSDRVALAMLLQGVRHVKSLSLCTPHMQAFPVMDVEQSAETSWNWELLRLKCDLLGIAEILKKSHKLQTLIIDKVHGDTVSNYLASVSVSACHCLDKTLETVKIFKFTGAAPQKALVKFLLENAKALRKMIIYKDKTKCSSIDELKISRELLSIHKASPNSEILIFE